MPWSLVSGCSVTSRAWTQASFSVFNLAIKSLMCSCRSRSCKMPFSSRRLCASSVGPKRRDTICIWIVFEVQLKPMHAGTVHILHWVKWLNASKLKWCPWSNWKKVPSWPLPVAPCCIAACWWCPSCRIPDLKIHGRQCSNETILANN